MKHERAVQLMQCFAYPGSCVNVSALAELLPQGKTSLENSALFGAQGYRFHGMKDHCATF